MFADCEKSLENVPLNVYESVCGQDIADYLGNNQRLACHTTTNQQQQDYTNEKNFLVPGGECFFNDIFLGVK